MLAIFYTGIVVYIYNKISSGGGKNSRKGGMSPLKAAIGQVLTSPVAGRVDGIRNKVKVVDDGSLGNSQRRPVVLRTLDDDHVQMIKAIEEKRGVKSCRRRTGGEETFSVDGGFSNQQGPVQYYNPLPKLRYVCGKRLESFSYLEMRIPCGEPPRLYPSIPDLTGKGKGIPPITSRFQDSSKRLAAKDFEDCDIPCKSAGSAHLDCVRTVDDTPFEIRFSMEGPQYYKNLIIDPEGYRKHKYWSTTSYKSEIPLPYFSWSEYKIQTPAVEYDTAIKGAVFMARNCNSRNNREALVKFLRDSGTFRVDSVSSCLHNADPPEGSSLKSKNSVLSKYLFYLALENQNEDDYITEKLWGSFESGVLPIYLGSPNVKEHIPENSVINVLDFESRNELLEYLVKVADDKELYESHQAWRTKPLPPSFHAKYDFTEVHSTCRTCRWAYAKMHGLGWNHNNQSLRELNVPRKVCLDSSGRILRPFVESWEASSALHGDTFHQQQRAELSCGDIGSQNRVFPIDGGKIKRTVWEQDGVIDLMIETQETELSDYEFWMKTSLKGDGVNFKTINEGHYRLQGGLSRYTFLVLPRKGAPAITHFGANEDDGAAMVIMTIRPEDGLPVRIRVIVEDVDTFHLGADAEENYFAEQMIEDFYSPVEAFVRS